MRTIFLLAVSLLQIMMVELSLGAESKRSSNLPANRLCGALAGIQDGDRLPVVFEGILSAYSELHDPAELRCPQEVQPWTWVTIPPHLERYEDLAHLLKKDRGAYVRLAGELFGPELGPGDNPNLSVPLATGVRFHGLHGPASSRTRLMVKSIERIQPLGDVAFARPPGRQLPSPFPEVVKAEIPTRYPRHAFKLNLSGTVRAQVTVAQGTVSQVEVLEGDRTLAEETVTAIKTWQFEPDADARFTTTFVYRIDNVPAGAAKLTVHAELPLRVEVIAPRNDWQ